MIFHNGACGLPTSFTLLYLIDQFPVIPSRYKMKVTQHRHIVCGTIKSEEEEKKYHTRFYNIVLT